MTSPTRWTWVWVNSGSWWWTGRPGVLRFVGSQRVRHDWATELTDWCWIFNLRVLCCFHSFFVFSFFSLNLIHSFLFLISIHCFHPCPTINCAIIYFNLFLLFHVTSFFFASYWLSTHISGWPSGLPYLGSLWMSLSRSPPRLQISRNPVFLGAASPLG